MTPGIRRRLVRIGFGGVGMVFVGVAFWRAWNESQQQVLPGGLTLLLAGLLVVGGLVGGGLSWIALFGKRAPRGLIADFYIAQLGKYVPGGGIWQAAGQIGLSTGHGLTATRVAANMVVHGVIQLAAAFTLGGLVVLARDLPLWLRMVSGVGLAAPLLLHRTWMEHVLNRVGRWLRLDLRDIVPPDQKSIILSWLWSLVPIAGFGIAYGIMIHTLAPGIGVWRGAVPFAMAWGIGFALLPFPAGLGIREAALILLVGGSTAVVLATSLALRLLAIAGDVTLMLATRRIRE